MEAGKKTEIAMGDCIKSDLERIGEKRKKMIERRNRRLLTENVVEKEIMVNLCLMTVMPRK